MEGRSHCSGVVTSHLPIFLLVLLNRFKAVVAAIGLFQKVMLNALKTKSVSGGAPCRYLCVGTHIFHMSL